MHRSLAITSVTALLFVAAPPFAPSLAHATGDPANARHAMPRLELPESWFSVVEPYRYVETRRFERGWNRGADVVVADGDVRAPVGGRVRFAGRVAGRSVVTIESRVQGLVVVVTLTGLDRRAVQEGDRVGRGTVVGSGRDVHVGMYDRARRSRYLPVVGAEASVDVSPAEGRPSPIAGAITNRLLDAIRGDVGSNAHVVLANPIVRPVPGAPIPALLGHVPTFGESGALRSASGSLAGSPEAGALLPDAWPAARVLRVPSGPAFVGQSPTNAESAVARLMLEPVRSAYVGPPPTNVEWNDAGSVHGTVRAAHAVGDARQQGRAALRDGAVDRRIDTPEPLRHRARSGGAGPQGAAVRSTVRQSGDALIVSIPPDREGSTDEDLKNARVDATPGEDATIDAGWSIPAAFVALLAVLALAVRRRRRRVPTAVTRIVRPLPPILPTMHPRPARPVRTDGHSIVGGTPIAWPDTESGSTTHEPELLRHDADLLPERAAAPGPRVHDDRRGRDHPLPAAHGSGRVLRDGH